MPKQPTFAIVVKDPSKPEASLTPAKVAKQVDSPSRGQRIYWVKGAGMPHGFGLVVRSPTSVHKGLNATWVVQAIDPNGKSVRLKIARYGDMPVRDVVQRAVDLRRQVHEGTHRERKAAAKATADRNSFTIGDAFRLWVEHLEQHARPSTIRDAVGKGGSSSDIRGGYIRKHLGDWLQKPLAEVTKSDLVQRHRAITKGSGDRTANKVLKALRAAWNRARDELPEMDLPKNLLAGKFTWNHEEEGGPLVEDHELPQWWADVHELPEVLRDYYLVCLFTGARAMVEAATIQWDDVNLERGLVHFPDPKFGPKKAFTIPVARFVLDLLRRRHAVSQSRWVFPSPRNADDHIKKTRVTKNVNGKIVRTIACPHMLRRTVCTEADDLISAKQAEKLMNHGAKSNSAHGRYVIHNEQKLRAAAEKVAQHLLGLVGEGSQGQRELAG